MCCWHVCSSTERRRCLQIIIIWTKVIFLGGKVFILVSSGRPTRFLVSFSTSRLPRDPVWTWTSIAQSDSEHCSRKTPRPSVGFRFLIHKSFLLQLLYSIFIKKKQNYKYSIFNFCICIQTRRESRPVSGRRARDRGHASGRTRVGPRAGHCGGHVVDRRGRRVARQRSVPRGRPQTESCAGPGVGATCIGRSRGAHLRHVSVSDVAGAVASSGARSMGPVPRSGRPRPLPTGRRTHSRRQSRTHADTCRYEYSLLLS